MDNLMLAAQRETTKRFRTDVQLVDDVEELKTYDIENVGLSITTAPALVNLMNMTQGTGAAQRISDNIFIKRIQFRLRADLTYSNFNGITTNTRIRCLVFVDKQPVPSTLTPTQMGCQLLNNATNTNIVVDIDQFHNPVYVPQRYDIIYDKLWTIPPIRGTGSGPGCAGGSYTHFNNTAPAWLIGYDDQKYVKQMFDETCDVSTFLEAHYDHTAAACYKNCVYAMFFGDIQGGQLTMSYKARLQYIDPD